MRTEDIESTQYIDQLEPSDNVRLVGSLHLDDAGYHLISVDGGTWLLDMEQIAVQEIADYVGQAVIVVGAPVRSMYCHILTVSNIARLKRSKKRTRTSESQAKGAQAVR